MNLIFRRANANDAGTISKLGNKIWHEHYPSIISVEQINFMLEDRYSALAITAGMQKGEMYFLAYDGETPVALADIELKGDHYFLHKFYVDVASHRGGIGSGFFNYMLQQIDSNKPIRLQVNRQNYKAVNFYFKKGFIIELVGDFDIGGGYWMNDFVMVRKPSR
jgi:GNAT superfamily N-acetyltransferase